MKFLEPSIVVVDDKIDEVEGIISHYNSLGLGCKFFNADLIEGDSYPDKIFSDISIFFLDLIYSEAQPFDAELCATWIRSIIPENSFYVLIIWTKDESKAADVLSLLKQHKRLPYIHLIESKTHYPGEAGQEFNYSELLKKINNTLDNTTSLDEIQLWKKGVRLSANEVLGNLSKTPEPNLFNNKLKKIILSQGGISIKSSVDNYRKRSILFDALDNILVSNTKKNLSNEEITKNNIDGLYNLNDMQEPAIDKELNSWFHFRLDKAAEIKGIIVPGLISYNCHKLFKNLYSIQNDLKLSKIFEKQKINNVVIEDIVLVLNRPCDIAQNKFGNNIKLLSGVIIKKAIRYSSDHKKHPNKIDFNGATLPDSIKKYEHLFFSDVDDDITLMFDFRYIFSVPEKIFRDKFQNIKIFNKELLSEMQVEYSSYSSRLGITQVI